MKKVALKKVKYDEVVALQNELHEYSQLQRLGFNFWSIDDFVNAIIAVDIAHNLWIQLRKKIESDRKVFTINLKLSEAAVVMKCCYWKRDGRGTYETHVAEKYKNIIDHQLKNITPIAH